MWVCYTLLLTHNIAGLRDPLILKSTPTKKQMFIICPVPLLPFYVSIHMN